MQCFRLGHAGLNKIRDNRSSQTEAVGCTCRQIENMTFERFTVEKDEAPIKGALHVYTVEIDYLRPSRRLNHEHEAAPFLPVMRRLGTGAGASALRLPRTP